LENCCHLKNIIQGTVGGRFATQKWCTPSSTCLQNDGSSRFGAKLTLTLTLVQDHSRSI